MQSNDISQKDKNKGKRIWKESIHLKGLIRKIGDKELRKMSKEVIRCWP